MKKFWDFLRWVLLAFFLYAIVKSPQTAADIVRTIFDLIAEAFRGIIAVFDAFLNRT